MILSNLKCKYNLSCANNNNNYNKKTLKSYDGVAIPKSGSGKVNSFYK